MPEEIIKIYRDKNASDTEVWHEILELHSFLSTRASQGKYLYINASFTDGKNSSSYIIIRGDNNVELEAQLILTYIKTSLRHIKAEIYRGKINNKIIIEIPKPGFFRHN